MKDKDKTQQQLIKELTSLRRRIAQLERCERQREEVEETLKRSDQEKTVILGSISELVAYQDTRMRILWVNRAAAESVGVDPQQLVGRHCYEIWHQRQRPCVGCPVIKARKSGQSQEAEITSPDGRMWLIRSYPVRDKQGIVKGIVEVTLEITERKRVEEALRKSENKYRTILKNIEEGYYEVDLAGNFTFLNDAMCRIWGYSKEELIGMNNRQYTDKENAKRLFQAFNKVYRTGKPGRGYDYEIIKKDGTRSYVEASISLRKDSSSKAIGFRGIIRDITDRKQAEEQVERALRETRVRFEVSQALASAQTEDQVLDALIKQAGLYPQAYVAILTFDKQEDELACIARRADPFESGVVTVVSMGERFPASKFTMMNLFADSQPFVSDDVFIDERVDPASREILAQIDTASLAVIPLRDGNETEGLIVALAKPPGYFDEEKQHLYQTLAEQGAVALRAARLREEIRESQQRFQGLVETLSDWIWEVDQNGIYTYVSPMVQALLGYEPEEVLGKTPFDLMPPEEAERVKIDFEGLLAAHEPIVALENTNRHKDGRLVVFETSGAPFFDAEGRFKGYRGVDRDITSRKQAEDELREKQETINAIIETSQDWIWAIDSQGVHTYSNPAIERILGYRMEEIVGSLSLDLMHEDDKKMVESILRECEEKRCGWNNLLLRWRHKNGTYRYLESNAVPILNSKGDLIGFRGVDRDITERKQAEAALRESEEKYRDFVENINDIIYATDESGIVTYISPAIEPISGYTPSEIIGRAFSDFVYEEDLPDIMEQFQRDIAGHPEPREYRMLTKSGDVRWVHTSSQPFLQETRVMGVRGVLTDITERKQGEEALRRSYNQLQETFISTIKALASTVEMKDQYTAGHQPRVTQLACAIAEEMGLSEDQIEGIRMAGLIHDIGKIVVPAEILNKPGPLTEVQYEMIKMNPQAGYDILKEIKFPWPVAQIVLQHHELMDGSGYPQGLSGEGIMVEARILTVANVVEAMTAHRPYRPAYDIKEAFAEISQNRGVKYDSSAVDACLRLFTKKGFVLDPVLQ